jgi:hypothetical protein
MFDAVDRKWFVEAQGEYREELKRLGRLKPGGEYFDK